MNISTKYDIPQSYVVVKNLTIEEISRMCISPFYIANKCVRCKKFAHYGPKCTSCSKHYHYKCALMRSTCCGLDILPKKPGQDEFFLPSCPKCKQGVEFGPHCSVCHSMFHGSCITPYDECCQLNLYEHPSQQCGKCEKEIKFGPRCPFCMSLHHEDCVGSGLECCGVKITSSEDGKYYCHKCCRRLGLGSPMCQFCGRVYHKYCGKKCCGRPLSFEVSFIPSFKYVATYFNRFAKRRAQVKKLKEMVNPHRHTLRGMIRNAPVDARATKSIGSQTTSLDTICIVDVKTELEPKELDIPLSPPILEAEMSYIPETSVSYLQASQSSGDNGDSLQSLFDLLYNIVKKFPPQVQTQVKIDLFKTVTEAEMAVQHD